jgi:hypothetical protein
VARLGLEKAARSNSIDAVVTPVAVSSSNPANGLASHGPQRFEPLADGDSAAL